MFLDTEKIIYLNPNYSYTAFNQTFTHAMLTGTAIAQFTNPAINPQWPEFNNWKNTFGSSGTEPTQITQPPTDTTSLLRRLPVPNDLSNSVIFSTNFYSETHLSNGDVPTNLFDSCGNTGLPQTFHLGKTFWLNELGRVSFSDPSNIGITIITMQNLTSEFMGTHSLEFLDWDLSANSNYSLTPQDNRKLFKVDSSYNLANKMKLMSGTPNSQEAYKNKHALGINNDTNPIVIEVSGGKARWETPSPGPYTNGDWYKFSIDGKSINIASNDYDTYRFSRGKTYKFINVGISSSHPFKIITSDREFGPIGPSPSFDSSFEIVIPSNHKTSDNLYYRCQHHSDMSGNLSLLHDTVNIPIAITDSSYGTNGFGKTIDSSDSFINYMIVLGAPLLVNIANAYNDTLLNEISNNVLNWRSVGNNRSSANNIFIDASHAYSDDSLTLKLDNPIVVIPDVSYTITNLDSTDLSFDLYHVGNHDKITRSFHELTEITYPNSS
tara:strand:- start:3914 stop:5395 length:1482 start_codon:yes stop_codon:yes gene_type:complete